MARVNTSVACTSFLGAGVSLRRRHDEFRELEKAKPTEKALAVGVSFSDILLRKLTSETMNLAIVIVQSLPLHRSVVEPFAKLWFFV